MAKLSVCMILLLAVFTHGCSGADDLSSASTTGMSTTTASGYGYSESGVAGSERAAREDYDRALRYCSSFLKAAEVTGTNRYVLAAIASRESRVGNALRNGWGDNGNAYGIMQIDKRYHNVSTQCGEGPASYGHILQGAQILRNNSNQIKGKFPRWGKGDQLRGAIAAYNFGVSNVRTVSGIDIGTTGGDYSSDVVARAKYFRQKGF